MGKAAIVLAKKTDFTHNLSGHLSTAKSTDCLISLAARTAWADTVILGDSVTSAQVEKVVKPICCAVIVLTNCIAARVGPAGLGRGSSMPDIKSNLPDKPGLAFSLSSDSILPRISGPLEPAPPMPSKLARGGHWIGLKVLISPEVEIEVERSKA